MTDQIRNADGANLLALLDFLDQTPATLANFTHGLSEAEFRFQSSLDEFSMLENICHLRDLELEGYTPRIRRMLAEAEPVLPDFDGARVAAESSYNSEQPTLAFEAFQTARQENVERLRGLTEEELRRAGTLEGVGRITLRRLAELMRDHDEGHLEDLQVLRQRIESCRELTR